MCVLSGDVKGCALRLFNITVSVLRSEDSTEAGDPLGGSYSCQATRPRWGVRHAGRNRGGRFGFGDAESEASLPPQSPICSPH